MGESFELRVQRLFGSKLLESVPENSFPPPSRSWSVAAGEVERREWNRERGGAHLEREDENGGGGWWRRKTAEDRKKEFEGDLDEDGDDDDDGDGDGGEVDEETKIRDSVGLDPTLDNEDEEDEYDRAALCRENAGEHLYMGDVKVHGPYLNFHAVVPDFLEEPSDEAHHFHKDPRADHFAATLRLIEDKGAAENYHPIPLHHKDESSSSLSIKITEDDDTLKPILKRKEVQDAGKPKKRVRFDPGSKDYNDEVTEEAQDFPMVPQSMEASGVTTVQSSLPEVSPVVPDYIRNPSKYTHYTFESSNNGDDESNRQTFEDFLNLVKRANPDQLHLEIPVEIPKSVTFTPRLFRKKSVDVVPMDDSPGNDKGSGQLSGCFMGIVARDAGDNDACEMEEDDAEAPAVETNMGQSGRQYRSNKSTPGDSS